MVALLLCAAGWAQDPVVPQAGEPTPTGYQPIPVACKTESACSSYETYQTCEAATCDFMTDETLLARKVCTKDSGFTAWCVKPKEPPRSKSGACICDSGSPAGGWLAGVALLFVARQRRTRLVN